MLFATLADLVTDAVQRARINGMESRTGFHLNIAGQIEVMNLQKFGQTFGAGAGVKFAGQTFFLQENGTWTSSTGDELTQDSNGDFHVSTSA